MSHHHLIAVRPIWLIYFFFFGRVHNCQDKVFMRENFWKILVDGLFQAFIDIHDFRKNKENVFVDSWVTRMEKYQSPHVYKI